MLTNSQQRKAGIILSYLSQIIHMLSSLLYTPVMLRLLGQSEYGLYQLVYSTVAYLGLLSFGFSASYMRFYSRFKAQNSHDEIARLNGMFMIIFLCISALCLICGGIMLANIKSIFAEGLTEQEYAKAKILMLLMIINLALTFPNSVFTAIVSSKEKFMFQKLLDLLQNLFNPFLTLPLLITGFGSVSMVVITTVLTVCKLAANAVFCFKSLKAKFLFTGFQLSLFKEMWVFTFFIFINMIVDQINWSVDKILLGRFAGTAAVAIYGIGGQLNSMYLNLSTSVSAVFVPKVNRIVANTDDNSRLTRLFSSVGRVQFIILFLIISGFIFFGKPFILLWAGKGYGVSYNIALLLMVPVTVSLIQNLGIEIQRAKNMHKARSVVYLSIALSNIFVSIPCIKHWGAQGAAIGTAITLIAGNIIFMNWYYHNRIGLNMLYFWKEILKFIPAVIPPAITGIVIIKFVNLSHITLLFAAIIIYTAVYCASMWFLGMNSEEKSVISSPVNKILLRKS